MREFRAFFGFLCKRLFIQSSLNSDIGTNMISLSREAGGRRQALTFIEIGRITTVTLLDPDLCPEFLEELANQ